MNLFPMRSYKLKRNKSAFKCGPLIFIIELLLISILICSCSVSGKRYTPPVATETETESVNDSEESMVGLNYNIGKYEQNDIATDGKESIEWKVIDETEDSLLLLSQKAVDCVRYCNEFRAASWDSSDVYSFLNETFYNRVFDDNLKDYILDTGKGKLFLLSRSEFYKYYARSALSGLSEGAIPFGKESVCDFTEYANKKSIQFGTAKTSYWTLRNDDESSLVYAVGKDGTVTDFEINCKGLGLRSAMWINKKLLEDPIDIFVELNQYEYYSGETFSFKNGEVHYITYTGQSVFLMFRN